MQSIVSAAQMIQTDEAKIVLAGGMEAMSQAPFVIRGRDGFTLAPGGKLEDSLMVALLDSYCGMQMASTAELYAEQQGITRQAQDELALRSQQKADEAIKRDAFRKSLMLVPLLVKAGEATGEMLTDDDHRRPQTTMEGLAKLRASFGKNGTVTAGNASGIVDGGAAVVVMALEEAQKRNLKPLGRIVNWGIAGVYRRSWAAVVLSDEDGVAAGWDESGFNRPDRSERGVCGEYLAVEKESGWIARK